MNALAWSLVHFVWQGAAIAALAAALMHVFKSPSTRYLVGVAALALMLMSFAVTFGVLRGSAGNGAQSSPSGYEAPVAANTWVPDYAPSPSIAAAPAVDGDDFVWVARAWLVGVFALALRIVFGLLVLEHLRRRGLTELPAALVARFRELQRRIGIDRLVRYCECQAVRVPAVIGLFRPIVLIPVRALTGLSPEQLEAVVAHELGHVKRFDVAVNFVQAIAETLFFFHPAMWWLNKRIRADREDCCDDVAVSVTGGKVGYARALAEMASWRAAPHFAMAATGGPIAARVARLLGVREHGAGARTAGAVTASLALAIALVAGGVSFGWAKPAEAAAPVKVDVAVASPQPAVSVQPAVSTQPVVRVAASPVIAQAPPSPASPASPASPPNPPAKARAQRPAAPAQPAIPAKPAAPTTRAGSFIEDMKAAGYDNLDVDELVAMKVHGITPDYIRGMRATGLDPDIGEIIGMKIQGITPEYVQKVRDMGFAPGANELIAMKVQDITPEYVKGMRAMGFEPDTNEIIGMKVQDITPEYVQQIRDLGFKPDANEIIAMKVQGITPDYVREMRAQGFDVGANELIAMKVQDITPEYRKLMESAGYKLDANELIQAKVMGITPEFIQQAVAHGFKNLEFHKLIQLKNADIF
jgi:beta-lactamase regulating signal transducer with metallopeptidase domain/sporulation protein YlmC with PRC-barrel domain